MNITIYVFSSTGLYLQKAIDSYSGILQKNPIEQKLYWPENNFLIRENKTIPQIRCVNYKHPNQLFNNIL